MEEENDQTRGNTQENTPNASHGGDRAGANRPQEKLKQAPTTNKGTKEAGNGQTKKPTNTVKNPLSARDGADKQREVHPGNMDHLENVQQQASPIHQQDVNHMDTGEGVRATQAPHPPFHLDANNKTLNSVASGRPPNIAIDETMNSGEVPNPAVNPTSLRSSDGFAHQ
ncbi:unnamed protein product [Linum trigynum]|uniref:Uncharacterized protein n=1 Tax=Linum trigynum TaxID=586398 RepID=A0AAV2D0P7_9ROSI